MFIVTMYVCGQKKNNNSDAHNVSVRLGNENMTLLEARLPWNG